MLGAAAADAIDSALRNPEQARSAAERFLRKHKGKVGLITVSIGGNDVTACARQADPIPCVVSAVGAIKENVTKIAERLRKAAGKKVRIVGTTYPDVILGEWVRPSANQDLARLSVVAFQALCTAGGGPKPSPSGRR